MKIQIPKNVRQIGEIHSSHKIYVEDYVATFFRQLCRREGAGAGELVLYGQMERDEDNTYYFINGAGRKEDAASFPGCTSLGQAFLHNGPEQIRDLGEEAIHQSGGLDREYLLCFIDSENGELTFESIRGNRRTSADGYYIFYDQNETMQNFLIDWYGSYASSTERGVRDQAAKYFRNTYFNRQEEVHQRKIITLLYTASLMLLTLCCIAGISMMNQYDKMKNMEAAIEHLATALEEKKLPQENVYTYTVREDDPTTAGNAPEPQGGEESMADSEEAREARDQESGPEAVQALGQNVIVSRDPADGGTDKAPQEIYVVQEGDTLAQISKSFYGTTSRLTEICELNGIQDPNNIIVGQKIVLP